MKPIELVLFFIAPFHPRFAFSIHKTSKNKSVVIVVALLFYILILPFFLFNHSTTYLYAQSFYIGFVSALLFLGLVLSIMLHKLFKRKLEIVNSISIIYLCSIPLAFSEEVKFNPLFQLACIIYFLLLLSYGIHFLFHIKFFKSLILVLSTFLMSKILTIFLIGITI